jgi:hypothetical protein
VAIERLPETVRAPSVARAAVSPSAVVVTGVGVGIGLLAGLPVLAAIGVGVVCWGARVGVAAGRARRRRRQADRPEPIDPYAVPEPWRNFVQEALSAEQKFEQAVERCQPGPLQDRLRQVGARVGDGVRECWRAAHLGASISAVVAGLDPAATSRQLREVQDQRRTAHGGSTSTSPSPSPSPSREALDATEAALAARLQTATRMQSVVQRTTDRLRVLTAQLDEAVADAVELSLAAGDPTVAQPLAGSVESVVGEIESLRRAMEEAEAPR